MAKFLVTVEVEIEAEDLDEARCVAAEIGEHAIDYAYEPNVGSERYLRSVDVVND